MASMGNMVELPPLRSHNLGEKPDRSGGCFQTCSLGIGGALLLLLVKEPNPCFDLSARVFMAPHTSLGLVLLYYPKLSIPHPMNIVLITSSDPQPSDCQPQILLQESTMPGPGVWSICDSPDTSEWLSCTLKGYFWKREQRGSGSVVRIGYGSTCPLKVVEDNKSSLLCLPIIPLIPLSYPLASP